MKLYQFFLIITLLLISSTTREDHQDRQGLIEKIYAQTDRSLYFPGETIWFKAYVVDGNQQITPLSEVAHAELVAPNGTVVGKANLRIKHGYTNYQFDLNKNAPGGRYLLRISTEWMKMQGEEFIFSKEIFVQKIVKPNLLMTLDLKKTTYGPGSIFSADLTINNLENKPLKDHPITYRVQIDGKPGPLQNAVTDEEGEAVLTGQLPAQLTSSDALLLVTLNHNDNVESISRSIPVILNKVDLQFLPEGGQAIMGQPAIFAFKAISEFGKPVDIDGVIEDEEGGFVQRFTSSHDGMGSVSFTPTADHQYFARITTPFRSETIYTLDRIAAEGVHLNYLYQEGSNKQEINIHSSLNTEIVFQILKNGEIAFEKEFSLKKGSNSIPFSIAHLSMGIHKILIKNKAEQPLAERITFFHPDREMKIDVKTNKSEYDNREKIKVSILTTDSENKPVPANLSVSITDEKINTAADDKQGNILANLLITSELKGKVHEPNYYFEKNEKDRIVHLDLLMKTNGWRSYLSQPVTDLAAAPFQPERAIVQTGWIVDKSGAPSSGKVIVLDNRNKKLLAMEVDSTGCFSFERPEDFSYILLAYREDRRKVYINTPQQKQRPKKRVTQKKDIAGNSPDIPVPALILDNTLTPVTESSIATTSSTSTNATNIDAVSMSSSSMSLSEVVVTGYGTQTSNASTGYSSVVDSRDLNSTSFNLVEALAGQAAGIEVSNETGSQGAGNELIIRGTNTVNGNGPLYVLDGVPYQEAGVDNSVLSDLNPDNIESVTVLKGAAATAVYGSQGAQGVILIQTRNMNRYSQDRKKFYTKPVLNVAYQYNTNYKGNKKYYGMARDYYQPLYASTEVDERTDFRNTIYWNPVIQTDKNGQASFETFTSDALTSFAITVEGINAFGQPGYQSHKIFTKKEFSISSQMPAYLSVGDTLKLPVTITNNSDKLKKGTINVKLPKGVTLLYPQRPITYEVAANSFKKITLICLPEKTGENLNFKVSVDAGKRTDQFQKKIDIISPEFPVEMALSGVGDRQFEFNIKNSVEYSIRAELNIYLDAIGQAMDGIEGLLGKPHGCFEQTSSYTYPNVLVLDYLRTTGKTNKTLEARALNYIDFGYKRLMGFETKINGFEWFGGLPPHEVLTAYGILEFTAMKKVYPGVSQKMLDRTVKWLLGRKDGKGGFKKASKGRNTFHKASPAVANAYIVYSLTRAGIIKPTELEYQTALAEALQSGDAYRMSLMARAAHFRKDFAKENELLKKLSEILTRKSWETLPVAETIMISYGKDRYTETAALMVLAMMPHEQYKSTVYEGVKFILNKRKRGRFGATQATCLSIEAIIEYAKLKEEELKKQDDYFYFTVNDHEEKVSFSEVVNGIVKVDALEDFLMEGTNYFGVRFSNNEANIPFSLSVNYNTSLPDTHPDCRVKIATSIENNQLNMGDNLRLNVAVTNTTDELLPMTTALVGIPAGTTLQPWQLKELLDKEQVAYYEIYDHYLVLYWRTLQPRETKTILLDLPASFAGHFRAAPACAYLYYTDEQQYWERANDLEVRAY